MVFMVVAVGKNDYFWAKIEVACFFTVLYNKSIPLPSSIILDQTLTQAFATQAL